MTELIPITALGAVAAQSLRLGRLTIRDLPDLALASLSMPSKGQASSGLGLTLPGPGRWTSGTDVAAFWTGPGQWMIEGPGLAETDFAALIAAKIPGVAVTEQTDGFAGFAVEGPGIDRLLERLINLPTAATAPGCATRTGLHHMSVFVIRETAEKVVLLAMRSMAGTLWDILKNTAEQQVEEEQ